LEEYYNIKYKRAISNLQALVILFEDEVAMEDHKYGAFSFKG
jgi:hypothetical protein